MEKAAARITTAILAIGLSTSISHAGYFVPGETMGVSLDSPLPEGVFAFDLEEYGRSDVQNKAPLLAGGTANVGVNIPVLIWSTPFTFYNTRLEMLAALPFTHLDGAGIGRIGAVTYALGPILGHDFGNGLTGGVSAFVRTPDPSQNTLAILGQTLVEGDFRESLQYTTAGGYTFIENIGVTTAFNHTSLSLGQNDFLAGDFTIQKTIDRFTFGFTGYGTTDLENRVSTSLIPIPHRLGRQSKVELGGLLGYNFGRFMVRAIVVRSVLNEVSGVRSPAETSGFFVVSVPLYVAPPTVAPVVARY